MTLVFVFALLPVFWFMSSFFGRIVTDKSKGIGNGIPVFFGSIFIVSVIATVLSSGITILLPILVLFIFLMLKNRKVDFFKIAKDSVRDLVALTLFTAFLICVTLPVFLGLENGKVLSGDYLFYGKLGEFMTSSGIETKDLNYFKLPQGKEVYHYFDLWFAGFLKKTTGCNIGQSVFLTYFVFFSSMLWYLILDVLKLFLKTRVNFLIGALSLLCLLGLSGATYLFSLFFGATEFGDFNGFMNPKLILIYLVAMSLFLAIWRKDNWLVVMVAFVSIFLYASIVPALIGVVAVFFILNYKWKIFERQQLFPILILFVGCIVFGMFYFVFRSGYDQNEIYNSGIDLSGIKTRINIFGKTSIYIALGLLPLLILLFLNKKNVLFKPYSNVLLVFLGGFFFGLSAWVLLCNTTDSVQLWSNFYYPVIGCLYFVFIAGFFRKWSLYIISLVIMIDFIYPVINQRIVSDGMYEPSEFAVFNGKRIGFLNFYDPELNVYSKNDKIYFGNLKGLISFSDAKVISLSTPEIEIKDADYEAIVRSSNLYSLHQFDFQDTVKRLNDQRMAIKQLDLDYIFIHRKRTERSELELLGPNWSKIESPEPDYELYKKRN